MPASIKIRDSAVQTTLTGSTVYALPKRRVKRNIVDLVLMIMDEDGPIPMNNMRVVKKTRNAVDQFYDEHQVEYEMRGGQTSRDQINRVHTHNNAFPKMYDELDKRRSITQTRACSSNQNTTVKFDPTCPKCIKRKKRAEEERTIRRGPLCRKCRNLLNKMKKSEIKLNRVTKDKIPKPKGHQTRCRSTKVRKPLIICSNKCFQCHLASKTKTVSTFKSYDNLMSVPLEVPSDENNEKNDLKSKSSHKKRVNKKPASLKSDVNLGNPETDTGPSVSSYNSFLSTEHEPMVE